MIGELSLTVVRETLTGVANKSAVILSLSLSLSLDHLLSFIFPLSRHTALLVSFSLSPSSFSLFANLPLLERRVHSLFLALSVQFRSTPLNGGDDDKDITATTKAMITSTTKTLTYINTFGVTMMAIKAAFHFANSKC